jgi:hypothetical protein
MKHTEYLFLRDGATHVSYHEKIARYVREQSECIFVGVEYKLEVANRKLGRVIYIRCCVYFHVEFMTLVT